MEDRKPESKQRTYRLRWRIEPVNEPEIRVSEICLESSMRDAVDLGRRVARCLTKDYNNAALIEVDEVIAT